MMHSQPYLRVHDGSFPSRSSRQIRFEGPKHAWSNQPTNRPTNHPTIYPSIHPTNLTWSNLLASVSVLEIASQYPIPSQSFFWNLSSFLLFDGTGLSSLSSGVEEGKRLKEYQQTKQAPVCVPSLLALALPAELGSFHGKQEDEEEKK